MKRGNLAIIHWNLCALKAIKTKLVTQTEALFSVSKYTVMFREHNTKKKKKNETQEIYDPYVSACFYVNLLMVKISYTKLRIILSEKNKFTLKPVHPFQDSLLKVSQYRIMLTSILKTGGKNQPLPYYHTPSSPSNN